MKGLYITLICLLFASTLSLPYEDEIALANSLEVGRDQDPNTWGCTGCTNQNRPLHSYFIQQNAKDVRAQVSVYAQYTVLAFRYTATLKNIWQDLLFAFQVQDQHSCDGCKVQKQYENMWNSILNQTIEGLKKVDKTNVLLITGISLGGGLAQLSFVDIQASKLFKQVKLTTWGAPRVGNSKWVDWLNIHTGTRRFYIKSDPIPALPRCLGLLCNYKQPTTAFACNTKADVCTCATPSKVQEYQASEVTKGLALIAKESLNNDQDVGSIIDHIFGYKTLYNCVVIE